MLRFLKNLAIIGTVGYLLVCILLYSFQEKLLFHPFPLDATERLAGEEVRIPVADGIDLSAVWLRTPNARGALIYFHGNTGNLRRCSHQAQRSMTGHGYDVLVVDYRGFGKSPGTLRHEDDLLLDAERVYEYVRQSHPENRIAVLGYSLGSGPATHVASVYDPQHLLLVAPYRSIPRVVHDYRIPVPSFLVKYPLRNEAKLPEVDCPVTIAHGTRDNVIPFAHGEYLGNLNGVDFHRFEGMSHRGIILSSELRRVIGAALR